VVDITFVEFNYLIFLTNWLTLLNKREGNGKMIFFFQNIASGMLNKTTASFKGKAVVQLIIYILFLIATSSKLCIFCASCAHPADFCSLDLFGQISSFI